MRKFLVVAAIGAVATLGMAGRAQAQAFYPKTTDVPARVQGGYAYPSQYPTYPGQYSTTSRKRHHDDDKARRDRDRDDDDRNGRNDSRDQYGQYGQRSTNGYGAYGAAGIPSRVGDHDSASRSRSTNGNRDGRWNRDGR
ncbi:MAG TPA: hypothetical protein VGH98_00365 [Gemmatimonadaceae bacterium]